jgi:transcriptional regulator with XRE-family HTH domain
MTPLSRLVVETMRARGWSMQQVEARGISHSSLHGFTQPKWYRQPPRKSSLERLANALDLPLSKVQKAAVDSVGYIYDEQPSDDLHLRIASLRELSPEERAEQVAKIRALLNELDTQ